MALRRKCLVKSARHRPQSVKVHCFVQQDKALPDQSGKGNSVNQSFFCQSLAYRQKTNIGTPLLYFIILYLLIHFIWWCITSTSLCMFFSNTDHIRFPPNPFPTLRERSGADLSEWHAKNEVLAFYRTTTGQMELLQQSFNDNSPRHMLSVMHR